MKESENKNSDNLDENLDELHLTVKEAAKYIDESAGVVRNWLRELKSHIPTIQGENGYHYFNRPALERLLLIKQLSREQNYSIKQIIYHFNSNGKSVKPEQKTEVSDLILKDLKVIKDKLDLQEQFNQVLVKQLEKQQQHIEQQQNQILEFNKNNERLLSFQESQQVHQETAATSHKKGLFSRLLRRSK
jgi:DNA-binding transcriptional MerR regulator